MATVAQSAALSILKFDDTTGALVVQSQLHQSNPAVEQDLHQWKDAAGNVLASIAYKPSQGYTAYLKLYDTVYTPGFPYGTYFKATYASINTFGTKVYFDGNTSGVPVSWAFRDNGYNEGLVIKDHGLTLTTGSLYTGGLTILSSNATYTALTIKGAASQTGNLLEWQNSSGTILARVNAYGDFFMTGGRLMRGANDYGANVNITNESDIKGIVLRANASQTLNLTEWQNSSGTAITKIDAYGQIFSPQQTIVQTNPGAIVLQVQGAASQTADLQQWKNNNGSVATSVQKSGSIVIDPIVDSGTFIIQPSWGGVNEYYLLKYRPPSGSYNIASIKAGVVQGGNGTFSITQLIGGESTTLKIDSAGKVGLGLNNTSPSAQLDVLLTNVSTTGISVKGVASQTASLQEWKDSAGNIVGKFYPVNPGGDYVLSLNGDGNGPGSYSSIIIGGRWIRNEQRTALSKFGVNTGEWHLASNPDASAIAITDNQVGVFANSTSLTTFTVQAVASQTANLTEWKDSSGTVLSSVSSSGLIRINNTNTDAMITSTGNSTYDAFRFRNSGGLVLWGAGGNNNIYYANNGIFALTGGSWTGGRLSVDTGSTTAVGITVRGQASQTADLQQWQNSAGTTLAAVSSGGSLYGTGIYASYLMQVISGASSQVALTVKGTTSQTANLQEWQNSNSTVLAKVDANGNFSAVSKSFDIPHPTKDEMRLRYASLEGPENGVYIRATIDSDIIELPDYWVGLVHENSITAHLTPFGSKQDIYIEKIEDNKIYIGGNIEKAFLVVYAERKDIDHLTVEYNDPSLPGRPRL